MDAGREATYVPLVGRIAAGGPILAEEYVEDVFPLPKQLVGEGTLFLLEVSGDSMIDAAICSGALSDVTKGRQAETERARLASEMKARLAAIVDSSEDAIISRNLNDVITTWNVGAERVFGYSAPEIVGRSFTVLVPPDRRDEVSQIRQRIEQGERVAHHDTVRVAKDGRQIACFIPELTRQRCQRENCRDLGHFAGHLSPEMGGGNHSPERAGPG